MEKEKKNESLCTAHSSVECSYRYEYGPITCRLNDRKKESPAEFTCKFLVVAVCPTEETKPENAAQIAADAT